MLFKKEKKVPEASRNIKKGRERYFSGREGGIYEVLTALLVGGEEGKLLFQSLLMSHVSIS